MGIRDTLRKIGNKGKIRDRCDKNPDTGEVICRRVRVNPDKTEVEVAGFTMVADASCNPTQISSFENEEGQLDALEKKFVPKIIGKCKITDVPEDY